MRPLAALALAVLALPARAGVLTFDAGPAAGAIYSADGYHVARFQSGEREDHWLVDGRVRVRGASGTLSDWGVLSADGSLFLHLTAVSDAKGNSLGVAAALNGRRIGKPFPEIRSPALSPAGRNAAYVAKTPGGWAVVSGQGVGPEFPDAPEGLAVTETATLYFATWHGTVWLYRNHKPIRRIEGTQFSASPDLAHIGVVVRDRVAGNTYVEVDGIRYGPYGDAAAPAFSRGSGHWAALASSLGSEPGSFDKLLVDGLPAVGATCSSCSLLVDDAGRAFQDVLLMSVSDEGQIHSFYLNGRELRSGGRPPRVGLLAGGGHYVYPMLTPRGVGVGFDGSVLEYDVPLPLPNAPVEFDGPREYHYWSLEGESLRFICGTTDKSDPGLTRCADRARRVFTQAQ